MLNTAWSANPMKRIARYVTAFTSLAALAGACGGKAATDDAGEKLCAGYKQYGVLDGGCDCPDALGGGQKTCDPKTETIGCACPPLLPPVDVAAGMRDLGRADEIIVDQARSLLYTLALDITDAGPQGATIRQIDLQTGKELWSQFFDGPRYTFALSDDGTLLYVGFAQDASIAVVDTSTKALTTWPPITSSWDGKERTMSLAVVPGHPDWLLVENACFGKVVPTTLIVGGVAMATSKLVGDFAFGEGTTLLGADPTYDYLVQQTVDATGFHDVQSGLPPLNGSCDAPLYYDQGRIFVDAREYDAQTFDLIASFDDVPREDGYGLPPRVLIPEIAKDRVYMLETSYSTDRRFLSLDLVAREASTASELAREPVVGLHDLQPKATDLRRWGAQGIVFTSGGHAFAYESNLVPASP